jgi:PAS domain S-box-containing protein
MVENTGAARELSETIPNLPDIMGRIADGFFSLDTNWQYTYMNKKAGEMLRRDPATMKGRRIWSELPAIMGESFYNASRNAMANQEPKCLEAYAHTEGSWVEYHIYPSPTGLSILFRDITKRKMAEEDLKRTELRYRALIEQASDAIMITDQQGDFLDVNPSLCKLFGYTKEELLGSNIDNLIDPEELRTNPIPMDTIATGRPILRERQMLHKDGTVIEVEANVKLIADGRILAIVRDVTERKKAAQQILKEKEISESIINSLPGVFFIREVGGNILRWNRQLEIISGYSADEIPGLKPFHFVEEKEKENIRKRVDNLLAIGRTSSEMIAVTKDGRKIPFYLTNLVIQLEGKTCLMIIGFDISESKKVEEELQQANEQLRHLSAHLQDVREEERKGIAREIHDELGQQLTALKMDLSWVMKKCNKEERVFEKLSGMSQLVDQTIVTVRRISSELRPSLLDDLGLSEALDWQSAEFEKRYGIKTRFQCQLAEEKIDSGVVTGFFRIYQESLTNVARHANAKTVLASLRMVDDHLILQVTDDGKGFDTGTAGNKGTFGLVGIKERTLMMGGEYSIFSVRDQGTVITVSVPLETKL